MIYDVSNIVVRHQSNLTKTPFGQGTANVKISGQSTFNIPAMALSGTFQVSDPGSTLSIFDISAAQVNLIADTNSYMRYSNNDTSISSLISLQVSNSSTIDIECPSCYLCNDNVITGNSIVVFGNPSPSNLEFQFNISMNLGQNSTLVNPPPLINIIDAIITIDQSNLVLSGQGVSGSFTVMNGVGIILADTYVGGSSAVSISSSLAPTASSQTNSRVVVEQQSSLFVQSVGNTNIGIYVEDQSIASITNTQAGNFSLVSLSDSKLIFNNTASISSFISINATNNGVITVDCPGGVIMGSTYVGSGSEVTLGPASAPTVNSQSTILMVVEEKSSLLVQFPLALSNLGITVDDQSTMSITNTVAGNFTLVSLDNSKLMFNNTASSLSNIAINATNNGVITIDCPGGVLLGDVYVGDHSTVTLDIAKSVSATGYGNIVLEQQSSLESKAPLTAANLTLLSGSKMQLDGTILAVVSPHPNIGSFVSVSGDSSIEFKNPFSSSSFSAATMTCTSESFLFHGQAIVSYNSKNPAHDTYCLIDVTMPQSTPYTMVWPKSTDVAPTLTFPTKFSVDFTNNRMTLNIHGMTMGSFIGILVGSAVAFAVLVVGAVFLFYRRWKKNQKDGYSKVPIINADDEE
ncbi:hypothetical protein SAMD00019534_086550 [Acytostelium subglobosum LB1]|uniref:hypothetical protein n=1 Tax=Acytostelium subglobosum LB1 TaxID=1410327 RepID=UPI000644DC1F|nr:hypothetical protein SAMD00019534_086550 [Acytostelium subglobosum LB1]GAM25480.1 hypothetical protein SAMD00019534_086550 [Acytostelium subglobosum LB1]|eukprot:XP_012751466.1 hypothetical protein SAMD00019534_086550 [Acytostelium subglobosum LB1]